MRKLFLTFLMLFFVFCLIGAIKAQNTNSSNSQPQNDDEKYYKSTEVDQKIKITSKPIPKTDGKCSEQSGRLSVRVFFHKSGKINKVEYIKPSSCDQFNENALSAAKQIKFKPAIKNGQEVSYTTIVEYSWSKY
jgi:TonB family protein